MDHIRTFTQERTVFCLCDPTEQVCFYPIANKYIAQYERLMRLLTTIDTIWACVVLRASPNWTSQISYDVAASLLRMLSD